MLVLILVLVVKSASDAGDNLVARATDANGCMPFTLPHSPRRRDYAARPV